MFRGAGGSFNGLLPLESPQNVSSYVPKFLRIPKAKIMKLCYQNLGLFREEQMTNLGDKINKERLFVTHQFLEKALHCWTL